MTTRKLLMAAATMCMAATPLFAQSDATRPGQPPAPKTAQPGKPTAQDMQKMMEEAGKLGPNHALLNGMIGDWNCDCTFWMPGATGDISETKSKGTATNTWALEKHFVKQDFRGSFAMAPGAPEMPFTGLGYTGFDNTKQKFVSTWMSTMETGIMNAEGTWDASSKTFTFNAECMDPMTNKPATITETIKLVDDNTHIFTMSGPGPDGKVAKCLEITYTRKGIRPTDATRPVTTPGANPPSTTPSPSTPRRGTNPGGG